MYNSEFNACKTTSKSYSIVQIMHRYDIYVLEYSSTSVTTNYRKAKVQIDPNGDEVMSKVNSCVQ